jgi:hypothetical protein
LWSVIGIRHPRPWSQPSGAGRLGCSVESFPLYDPGSPPCGPTRTSPPPSSVQHWRSSKRHVQNQPNTKATSGRPHG